MTTLTERLLSGVLMIATSGFAANAEQATAPKADKGNNIYTATELVSSEVLGPYECKTIINVPTDPKVKVDNDNIYTATTIISTQVTNPYPYGCKTIFVYAP